MKFKLIEGNALNLIGYHGSQNPNIILGSKPFYIASDKGYAENVALGYLFNYELMEHEIPTLYTYEVFINNPYICKDENEWDYLGDITALSDSKKELEKDGYDGIVSQNINDCIFYIVFDAVKQLKLIKKESVSKNKRW